MIFCCLLLGIGFALGSGCFKVGWKLASLGTVSTVEVVKVSCGYFVAVTSA